MKELAVVGALTVMILPLVTGCCLCDDDHDPVPNPDAPDKYAVLASTEMATEDDVKYNSEFWYDLVLTYCTLIEQGFDKDNIFVLYGDGEDGTSKYDRYETPFCSGAVEKITDISLKDDNDISKYNLCNVLCCLSSGRPAKIVSGTCKCLSSGDTGIGGFQCSDKNIPWLTDDDFLIGWVKGHASAIKCETALAFKSGTTFGDTEANTLLDDLKADRWALFFETCDAGGWLADFQDYDSTAMVVSSSPDVDECKQTSWTAWYLEKDSTAGGETEVVHGRFTYWVNTALRRMDLTGTAVDSDADENNLISILEDFDFAEEKILEENTKYLDVPPETDFGGVMQPAIHSPSDVAPCVFVRLANPGGDHEVFSLDHDDDNSTVPSVPPGTVPFDSPDIWVRHDHSDPVPREHQQPHAGKDNHVYAQVFNIGCADPSPVDVLFYYSTYTDDILCGDPTQWKPIGEGTITSLPPGEARVAHATWQASNMPEPDDYCLIAELSALEDKPNEDESVAFDNNKAQIKVEVVAADGL